MRKILTKVWQRELSPGQALNQIQDEFIKNRDGPNRRFWSTEVDDRLLYVLEAVRQKEIITTNEAEEMIREIIEEGKKWIIARAKRKARARIKQIEKSCCA